MTILSFKVTMARSNDADFRTANEWESMLCLTMNTYSYTQMEFKPDKSDQMHS